MAPLSDTLTLRLAGFDSHGTTRARHQGRSIEIEHGIPGETVRAEVFAARRPRGRIVDVLDPAPDRVVAPCSYFRDWACGGCQWQHIGYGGQVRHKQEWVDRSMREAGIPIQVDAAHVLEEPWRYRSTAGIALGKHAGFRRHASLAIVPIHDCPISHPLIGRLMAALNQELNGEHLPNYRGHVRLDVRLADGSGEGLLQVLIRPNVSGDPVGGSDLKPLIALLETIPYVAGVSLASVDGSTEVLAGNLFAPITVAGRPVWLAAPSFFQTNLRLLPDLIRRLREEATPLSGKRVADVYGGVGVFGLFLAQEAGSVVIIESDPLAVEASRITAEAWNLTNVHTMPARAEEALTGEGRFDVVLVDPPRSGLAPEVRQALAETRPPLLLYVSCLAESLARDAQDLIAAGYRIERLELFDFYPQTYHVELLAVFRQPALLSTSPA